MVLVLNVFANLNVSLAADRYTYRDSSGRVTGTASRSGGYTTYKDRYGRVTGNARTVGNKTYYRDTYNRQKGSVSGKFSPAVDKR